MPRTETGAAKDAPRRVLLPKHVQRRYGISKATRFRWERKKKLPPRDVRIGGILAGWYLSTIEAAERGHDGAQ